MEKNPSTDEEILDYIMWMFYGDGGYSYLDYDAIKFEFNKFKIHEWDLNRLWGQLKSEKLIRTSEKFESVYVLSDKGMALMRKYGSYSTYLASIKNENEQKHKIEKNDRRIKNSVILATLGVSLLTLILTQFRTQPDKEQQTTREDIQSIAKKLDSVLQATQHTQIKPQTKAVKDTATSK